MKGRLEGGFTLIELVVIITILGILAAFAVPRFVSLERESREAATQALAGSIRSGAALAHALWLAQGDPSSTTVTMEGNAIDMVNGYPNVTAIGNTLVEYAGFEVDTSGASAVFTKETPAGAPITNCTVSYAPAPVGGAPVISANTAGC